MYEHFRDNVHLRQHPDGQEMLCINRKFRKHLMQNGTGSMEVMDGLAGQSFTQDL